MKQYIHIKKDDREFIAKAFGVSERMVFKAIMFESDSDLAKKIRKLAYGRGGILMVTAPSVETLHDSDNVMRQYFPNGALLEANKETGEVVVIFKGETKKSYGKVYVDELYAIQDYAAALR